MLIIKVADTTNAAMIIFFIDFICFNEIINFLLRKNYRRLRESG